MKKPVLLSLILLLSATTAKAEDYYYIQQKRESANQQKMMLLQQIQHRKANPAAYVAGLNKPADTQTVSFKVASNGHYYVPGMMNGRTVNFIADTGASSIFLTQDDARKIGLNVQNLKYSKVYNTANGQVKAAETIIPSFKVGPIELANVPVSVSSVQSGQSLLGMSFFSRLKSYNVQNNVLTLNK